MRTSRSEALIMRRVVIRCVVFLAVFGAAASARAQSSVPDRRWSVDFGIGWDNGISGNINSGAIGTLNGQTAVILKNSYEDVYGTGLHLHFGGGYMLDEYSEIRASFTFQSLDADLVPMGDLGVSRLYGQYQDYQSFGLDVGYRQYLPIKKSVRGYGEGYIGLAFIDEIDVLLAAPTANLAGRATDFYDRTAAFTFGGNVGVMFAVRPQVDVFTQLGLRRVTGLSEIDDLVGTGLETINDHSARWAIPFTAGIRVQFR